MTLAVNGRFLGAPSTGVQRVGRSLLAAARQLALVDWSVVAPRGTDDVLVDRTTPAVPGRLGGLVWEQVVLPAAVGRAPIVSLANTAPVVRHRAATLVHDLAPLLEPAWFHRRMQVYARVALAAARRAEVVLAVSAHVADTLVARGVQADRVHVVRPAVSASWTPASDAAASEVHGRFGIDGPYVLQVGAHDPRKDAATLAAAHARVVGAHPHQLVLVGSPHPNLAPVVLPRGPSIVDAGRVSDDELRALFTGASALAFPSREEGFGLPPLEAQACGTPAIVADIPVLRESAGPTATFVAVGDVGAWAEALVAAVEGALPPPTAPTRTWADAARELVGYLEPLR